MTEPLQVAVVGIDGSGKSSLAASLAVVLAGAEGLAAGSAVADEFWIRTPEEDLCAPGFHPQGYAIAARLNRFFRRLTKLVVNNKSWYPTVKVLQMVTQDNAAVKLAHRYAADVMISDGNLLVSGSGRAFNYRGPADDPPSPADIHLAWHHLMEGVPLTPESTRHLPNLKSAESLAAVVRAIQMKGVWVPDHVLFLDLASDAALARVHARGAKLDQHENAEDMARARDIYLRVLEAVKKEKGPDSVHVIQVEQLSQGEVLASSLAALKPHLPMAGSRPGRKGALHEASGRRGLLQRVLTYRYLVRYMGRRFFEDAWRELFFPFSAPGKIFLRDGYSAGVMRLIYEQPSDPPLLERVWYRYPLHRAVRDRLAILELRIEAEIRKRLAAGASVSIFTGPSGFAYDVLRPLRRIATGDPSLARRIKLVAADLDPAGDLGSELTKVTSEIGVDFKFLRGDMTGPELRQSAAGDAPFDLALFVGLSSWLPKPPTIDHLRWLCMNLKPGGRLVTDCFTPAAYAIGGTAMGYKASYYPPDVYRALLDFCGFDARGAEVESGRDKINHVVVAARRA